MAELHVQKKRRSSWWIWLLIVIIIAAIAYYLYQNNYLHLDQTARAETSTLKLQTAENATPGFVFLTVCRG
ncbi:hypothetical protein [Rubrolithibacter danxiaensis]|uniref:hypothetical protein n=1 Tax=Rubrolithibacter danxiaensis TaxID=3390805 RepID=UPI003BF88A31